MFKNYLILKYLIIGSTPNQAQEPIFIIAIIIDKINTFCTFFVHFVDK